MKFENGIFKNKNARTRFAWLGILHALDQIFLTECPFPSLFLRWSFSWLQYCTWPWPVALFPRFFFAGPFLYHLTSCPFNSLAFSWPWRRFWHVNNWVKLQHFGIEIMSPLMYSIVVISSYAGGTTGVLLVLLYNLHNENSEGNS